MLTRQVKIKDAYPKKVYHMLLGHVKKRRKDSSYLERKRKGERWFMTRNFINHPLKTSTHSHILIKVYDLFLLGS